MNSSKSYSYHLANRQKPKVLAYLKFNDNKFYLSHGCHMVGTQNCSICLNDESLDDKHAILEIYDDEMFLIDLNSKSGTHLDDKPVKCMNKISLPKTCSIQFGNMTGELIYLRDDDVDIKTSELGELNVISEETERDETIDTEKSTRFSCNDQANDESFEVPETQDFNKESLQMNKNSHDNNGKIMFDNEESFPETQDINQKDMFIISTQEFNHGDSAMLEYCNKINSNSSIDSENLFGIDISLTRKSLDDAVNRLDQKIDNEFSTTDYDLELSSLNLNSMIGTKNSQTIRSNATTPENCNLLDTTNRLSKTSRVMSVTPDFSLEINENDPKYDNFDETDLDDIVIKKQNQINDFSPTQIFEITKKEVVEFQISKTTSSTTNQLSESLIAVPSIETYNPKTLEIDRNKYDDDEDLAQTQIFEVSKTKTLYHSIMPLHDNLPTDNIEDDIQTQIFVPPKKDSNKENKKLNFLKKQTCKEKFKSIPSVSNKTKTSKNNTSCKYFEPKDKMAFKKSLKTPALSRSENELIEAIFKHTNKAKQTLKGVANLQIEKCKDSKQTYSSQLDFITATPQFDFIKPHRANEIKAAGDCITYKRLKKTKLPFEIESDCSSSSDFDIDEFTAKKNRFRKVCDEKKIGTNNNDKKRVTKIVTRKDIATKKETITKKESTRKIETLSKESSKETTVPCRRTKRKTNPTFSVNSEFITDFDVTTDEELKSNHPEKKINRIENDEKMVRKKSLTKAKKENTTNNVVCDSTKFSIHHKIVFTNVDSNDYKDLIKLLGWEIINDPTVATILITNNLSRTFKFMVALARGIPIISFKWLDQIMQTKAYHLPYKKFCIKDPVNEEKFNYNLTETLKHSKNNTLFKKYTFFITPRTLPPPGELTTIIECCGGKVIKDLPTHRILDSTSIFYIVSTKKDQRCWAKLIKLIPDVKIISTEAILLSVMQHTVRFEDHIL